MADASSKSIVITGDVTVDWNLALAREPSTSGPPAWNSDVFTHLSSHGGGAVLLAHLVGAVNQNEGLGFELHGPALPMPIAPEDPSYHHSHATWLEYPRQKDDKAKVWRIHEFLGLRRAKKTGTEKVDAPGASIVLVNDTNLGFRDSPELWPACLEADPWIVLKMAGPLASGKFWQALHAKHADRMVVVIKANDLRTGAVQLSRALSWDRALEDVARLIMDEALPGLKDCAHVLLSFHAAGAILYSKEKTRGSHFQLVFDPAAFESSWELARAGRLMGLTACLSTALVRRLMKGGTSDPAAAVESGLGAVRALYDLGWSDAGGQLSFPVEAIAKKLESPDKSPFARIEVRPPTAEAASTYWTILGDRYPEKLYNLAGRIAVGGAQTELPGVPLATYGKLTAVDRQEIESLRSIGSLVAEYALKQQSKPFSVAVFGSPGSGKSFGIKELANAILPGKIEILEFNLSQFQSAADLHGALHQVRDKSLTGKIPLVFWDEFDCRLGVDPLGWLRHFLAPMQDGKFQQGEITHPIGKSIFVFAGGTARSLEEFVRSEDYGRKELKAPDFVSRLKGHLAVKGPNRHSEKDPHLVLRRAILIHEILKRDRPHLFRGKRIHIDTGVLRALLRISEYKHGTRSLEAIIAMSQIENRSSFERSALPPEAQLGLHVDPRQFRTLVDAPDFDEAMLEELAMRAHRVYQEHIQKSDPTHQSNKPFEEMRAEEREQNRDQVLDIPLKLSELGYTVVRSSGGRPPAPFSDAEVETMAQLEHIRWMRTKIDAGWKWGEPRNDDAKLHPSMLPWRLSGEALPHPYKDAMGKMELSESEKEKDRLVARTILSQLHQAGYRVVKPFR